MHCASGWGPTGTVFASTDMASSLETQSDRSCDCGNSGGPVFVVSVDFGGGAGGSSGLGSRGRGTGIGGMGCLAWAVVPRILALLTRGSGAAKQTACKLNKTAMPGAAPFNVTSSRTGAESGATCLSQQATETRCLFPLFGSRSRSNKRSPDP